MPVSVVIFNIACYFTAKLRFKLMEKDGIPTNSTSGYLYAKSSDGGVSF